MMKRTISKLSIVICIIAILSACSTVKTVESITITEDKVRLKVGDTHQLEAEIIPIDATDSEIAWYSSDETVATVDVNTGKVTAIKDGNSKITAKSKNGVVSEICWVFVDTPIEHPAQDELNQTERGIFVTLTMRDVLYDYFKEPNSVTIRDVNRIIISGENGEELIDGVAYYMTIAATNGFGGTTLDRFYVSPYYIYPADTYKDNSIIRSENIDDIDMTRLNRAIKEYFEEKGW